MLHSNYSIDGHTHVCSLALLFGITVKSQQQQERVLQLQLACAWRKQQLQQLAFASSVCCGCVGNQQWQTQSSSSQSSGCSSSSTLWHNLVLVVDAAVASWLERQCSSGKQGDRCLGNAFFNGSHSGESMAWLPKSHGRCISEKTNNSAKMAKMPLLVAF